MGEKPGKVQALVVEFSADCAAIRAKSGESGYSEAVVSWRKGVYTSYALCYTRHEVMIALLKSSILLLTYVITLTATAGDIQAIAPKWDWDMRCCFSQERMDKAPLLITITGRKAPVAHLSLLAPSTNAIGFDGKTNKFFPPNIDGTYAYGPQEDVPTDHQQWGSKVSRVIILNRISEGTYKFNVVGRYSGAYTLIFLRHGFQQQDSKKVFKNISIRPGETHSYTFSGWANTTYNGAPSTKPVAPFSVSRIHKRP